MSNSFGPPGQFGPPGPPPGPPGPPGLPPQGPLQGPQWPYGPPPGGPQPPRKSNAAAILVIGIGGTLVLALVAVVALGFMAGWFDSKAGDTASGSPAAPSFSSTYDSTGSGSYEDPTVDPTIATPDPTASAFAAVSAGDCLTVYDTGSGGFDTYEWSTDVPPAPVSSCSSTKALVKVSKVTDYASSCPSGTGRGTWSHTSDSDGRTTVLCLSRIYRKNYCLLAEQKGSGSNTRISLGDMTGVDCTDTKVPKPYDTIMHITGVYQHSGSIVAGDCSRVTGDTTRYYAWKVDDGRNLLCTVVYAG
ncbi:hypothetical protein ACFXJ5_22055 [Streptomyces sp. NPDC059373]